MKPQPTLAAQVRERRGLGLRDPAQGDAFLAQGQRQVAVVAQQPPGRLVAGRKQGDDQAKRPPRRIRVDILRHVPAPVGLASLGDERGEPFAVAPRPCCAVSGVSVLRRADHLGRRTAETSEKLPVNRRLTEH